MPTSVSCDACGKRLTVRDELLAKKLKCPACGATFFAGEAPEAAPPSPAMAAASMMSTRRGGPAVAEKTPRLHVSKSVILVVVLAVVLPTTFLLWKVGPGAARAEWEKREPDATLAVRDVVDRVLQAYLSQHGMYNPAKAHATPQSLDVTFVPPALYWSVPQKVGFAGVSTTGAFGGTFYPATGEVEVDVEVDGVTLPSGVVVSRGETRVHATGRNKDGKLTAEIDGKPAEVRAITIRAIE